MKPSVSTTTPGAIGIIFPDFAGAENLVGFVDDPGPTTRISPQELGMTPEEIELAFPAVDRQYVNGKPFTPPNL